MMFKSPFTINGISVCEGPEIPSDLGSEPDQMFPIRLVESC